MTDNGINQKVLQLKAQVANLEQLLATDEAAVAGQSDRLEQALESLQAASKALVSQLDLKEAVAPSHAQQAETGPSGRRLGEDSMLWRTLIDNLPDFIFVKDAESRFVINNLAHQRVLKAETQAELLGGTDFDIFPPDLAQQYYADEQSIIQSGQAVVDREEPYLDEAGQPRWLSTTKIPLRDEQGQIVGLVGISRDITERKETVEILRESEALYQSSLDALPQNVYRIDQAGRITFGNKAYLANLDMTLPECLGKTAYDFFPKELADKYTADDQRVMQTGQIFDTVEAHQSPMSDDMMYVRVIKAPVRDSSDSITGLQAIFWDVTAQQQAEMALSRRADELETVAQVSTATATILDTANLLQEVVDLTKERFGLYHAHIYLLNDFGDTLELAAGAGDVGRQMVAQGWQIPYDAEQSLVAQAARTGQGIIVNDVRENPDHMPNPLLPDTRAELAVPLIIGGLVLGVLDVQSEMVDRFSEEEVQIKTILAAQIAVALQNARQHEETRTALAEVQQSQAMLRTVIDATPDWIFIKDLQHRYQLVNQGYANDLQLDPADFVGKNDLELGFPEEIVKGNPDKGIRGFWQHDLDVIDSGQPIFVASEPAVIDGQLHYQSTIKVPLRDAEGQVWGVLGFVRDITEREQLLTDIRESRQLLLSVIDAIPDWILVKDREHRFRLVNQGFADSLHLAPDDIIGKNDIELGVPEEVVKRNPDKGIKGGWADDLEVMERGQTKVIEVEPIVIDGKPAFLNTIKVPMRDASGEVWGVLAYIRNITTLKQTEASLAKRANELTCLNDIGREMESTPPVPELLPWVTLRIPPAMQYPELCLVAIEYGDEVYGEARAIDLPAQMTHGLYVGGEILGRIYIAYTEKHDFLNEESALLGGIATRLGGYIENRRLFEQAQARIRSEEILRQVTDRIRGSVDVDTIMRTAAQEVGQVLGRPAFVHLGNGDNGEQPQTSEEEKEL
jgi:PAS domain S-box-containing protein